MSAAAAVPFTSVLTEEAELRALIPPPPPERVSARKQIDRLDRHARAWIARSRLCLVATTAADGSCDVSPRGGPAGWVRVLDDTRLVLPEAPGNRRVDSLRNVLTNPHSGLLFVVAGRRETLRVNGRAFVTRDPELLGGIPGQPLVALGVAVAEVFLHCSKAFVRSELWDPATWPDPSSLPSAAQILRDHAASNGLEATLGEVEEQGRQSVRERLW